MKPDWILVANAAEARLLQGETGSPLAVLHAFHHPDSRARSSELGDDERGRESSDRSHGGVAYAARVEPQRKEHLRFAREIADHLEDGARQGLFSRLFVFAPSPFLGELKARLGDGTQRRVAGTEDVNLAGFGLEEIERRVQHARGGPVRPA